MSEKTYSVVMSNGDRLAHGVGFAMACQIVETNRTTKAGGKRTTSYAREAASSASIVEDTDAVKRQIVDDAAQCFAKLARMDCSLSRVTSP